MDMWIFRAFWLIYYFCEFAKVFKILYVDQNIAIKCDLPNEMLENCRISLLKETTSVFCKKEFLFESPPPPPLIPYGSIPVLSGRQGEANPSLPRRISETFHISPRERELLMEI